jgi:hypothetical protein
MTKEQFAKVGKLRDDSKLSRQKLAKQLVKMETVMNEVVTNQQRMIDEAKAAERAKTLAELKAKKKEAIEFKDTEEALEVDRQIVKLESETPKKTAKTEEEVWYDANKHWYANDVAAKGLVNAHLAKCEAQGLPFSEAIKGAEAKVKKAFPYHFDDDVKETKETAEKIPTRRAAVEKSSKPLTEQKKTRKFSDLDPALASIARRAAKASGLTEEQYMSQMAI